VAIGLQSKIGKSESAAWAEIERLHLPERLNEPSTRVRVTFGALAAQYLQIELSNRAATAQYLHKHIVNHYLLPRWQNQLALGIKPLQIQQWIDALAKNLAHPTRAKIRAVMGRIYNFAETYDLIPLHSNPVVRVRCRLLEQEKESEPLIVTPQQAFQMAISFPLLERTLVIVTAATGLRISECLGLQWQDVDADGQKIHVTRTWLKGQVRKPKSRASAKPVPMTPLLAQFIREWQRETPYGTPTDWVFPSFKLRGKKPRTGSVMAQSYLRPAAEKMGVLGAEDHRRFGFHNLRHSLATFLVTQTETDPKTVQALLRHAHVRTTLDLYTHANQDAGLAAQAKVMEAMRQEIGGGAD
jgi:integrase